MYKNIPEYRAVSGDIFSSSETIETGNRGRKQGDGSAVLLYGETLSSRICGVKELMRLV